MLLSAAAVRQAPDTRSDKEPPIASIPTPRRIMVVDDNEDAAESLTMLLGMDGHDARVAFNGRSALALVEDFKPEIALLDIGMPDMDGFALARALRQTLVGPTLYLVAVTGWGQQEDRARTAAAGFDHHLTKPVDPDELTALLAGFKPAT